MTDETPLADVLANLRTIVDAAKMRGDWAPGLRRDAHILFWQHAERILAAAERGCREQDAKSLTEAAKERGR